MKKLCLIFLIALFLSSASFGQYWMGVPTDDDTLEVYPGKWLKADSLLASGVIQFTGNIRNASGVEADTNEIFYYDGSGFSWLHIDSLDVFFSDSSGTVADGAITGAKLADSSADTLADGSTITASGGQLSVDWSAANDLDSGGTISNDAIDSSKVDDTVADKLADGTTLTATAGVLAVTSVSGVTGADEDNVTASDLGGASANISNDGTIEWEDAEDLNASGGVDGALIEPDSVASAGGATFGDNVGIGDSSPSARLTVKGVGATTEETALFRNSSNDTLLRILDNGTFLFNDTTFYVDNVNNRLGINTASPAKELEIQGDTNPGIELFEVGGTNSWQIYTDGGDLFIKDASNDRSLIGFDNSGYTRLLYNMGTFGKYISGDGNDEGIYINNDGDVGISTDSPSTELDVNGTATADSLISSNGATFVGNVGIGETSPTARLHIKGSGNTSGSYAAKYKNSDDTDIMLIRNDGFIDMYSGLRVRGAGNTDGTNGLLLRNSDNDNLFVIKDGGSVRIGGTSNDGFFQVMQDSEFNLRFQTSSSDTFGLGFGSVSTRKMFITSEQGSYRQAMGFADASGDTDAIFAVSSSSNSGSDWTTLLKVEHAGNVGISDSSPTSTLDVNGSVRLRSYEAVASPQRGDIYFQNVNSADADTILIYNGTNWKEFISD